MPSPRALLLTPVMPAASGNGLAMRAGLLLEGLARTCEVEVLVVPVFGGVTSPSELATRLARRIGTLPLPPATGPSAVELARRLGSAAGRARFEALHPLPALCRGATVAAAEAVRERASGTDLVLAFRAYLAPFLDLVLEAPARPAIVLDLDEVESRTHERLGHGGEAERFARLERHYLPLFDRLLSCSPDEGLELGLDTVTTIPNAVRPPAAVGPPTGDHELLLVGNLSYEPNVEAARWLCERVLPWLAGVRLAIVGSRPAAEVLGLSADPRVTVAPDVDDVAPWYAGARVAVVPLLRGGGTRIKLIEAFAHRRPVVATAIGAAGLPWPASTSPVVIADDPRRFADACRALLDDPARAARLAAEGEALVRATATVDVVAGMIEDVVRNIVNG